MLYYFTASPNLRFPGRQGTVLPIVIHNDICKAITSNTLSISHGRNTFDSLDDSNLLTNLWLKTDKNGKKLLEMNLPL